MTFLGAAFWGITWTVIIFIIFGTWGSIFKLNLNIPFFVFLISIPVVWVASTVFIFFASDRGLRVGFIIWGALVFLSIFANKVVKRIEKSKR